MKNILFILFCIVVASTSLLYATDPFIIGTYQQFSGFNSGAQATIDTLFERMNAAKYNLVMVEQEDPLQSFIAGSNHVNNAIKIVPHLRLSNGTLFENKYHYAFLPFEAEYFNVSDTSDVIGSLPYEQRWYTCDLNNSFDSVVNTDNASNGAYMSCNPTSGMNTPRIVMRKHYNYWMPWTDTYYPDFSYYLYDNTNVDSTYNVVMRLKIKMDPNTSPGSEWLCGIRAEVGYDYNNSLLYRVKDFNSYYGFTSTKNPADSMYIITKAIYNANTTKIDANGYKYFDFKITRNNLVSPIIINGDSVHIHANKREMFLYPIVKYYDKVPVEIDCVELMNPGSVEYDSANATNKINRINSAVDSCLTYSSPAIGGYTGLDEPMHAQYPLLDRVINRLRDRNIQYYRSVYSPYAQDSILRHSAEGKIALLNNSYIDIAHPQQILPQFYCVIRAGLSVSSFNCSNDSTHFNGDGNLYHFQTMLTNMGKSYEQAKAYCADPTRNVKFLPIIQSYGLIDCVNNQSRWSYWMLPPTATMRALCYLPLCYQPDGIFYYSFSGFGKTGDQLSQVALVNQYNPGDPIEYTSQYYAVKEANTKISVIGPMIRNMTKESNFLIKPNANADSIAIGLNNSLCANASVRIHVTDGVSVNNNDEGSYIGFVQGAKFRSTNNVDYLMLVNRRTNEYRSDIPSEEGSIQTPNVHTDNYFRTIRPQNVVFQFPSTLTQKPRIVDVYTGQTYRIDSNYRIVVCFEAGEGKLLRIERDNGVCRVSKTIDGSTYQTIASAMESVRKFANYFPSSAQTISIDPDTYYESIHVSEIKGSLSIVSATNDSSATIIGGSSSIIGGSSTIVIDTPCIINDNPNLTQLSIKYLKLQNCKTGISVTANNNANLKIQIDHCVIQNMVKSTSESNCGAGAIVYRPVDFTNCSFINNQIVSSITGDISYGGAIYAQLNSGQMRIAHCVIKQCAALSGSAIYVSSLYQMAKLYLEDNMIAYNYAGTRVAYIPYSTIRVENVDSLVYCNNICANNSTNISSGIAVIQVNTVPSCLFNNNTFVANTGKVLKVSNATSLLRIKNNVICGTTTPSNCQVLDLSSNEANFKVSYNMLYNNGNNTLGTSANYSNNQVTDPGLGTDYTPLWTSTAKSICIDNGDPDTDGDGISWVTDTDDRDGDVTRLDIGAKKVPLYHYNYITTLQAGTAGGKNVYNWICFPYMDKLYNSGSPETNEYIFDTYHGNGLLANPPIQVLNTIQWNYNTNSGTVNYGIGWNNTTNPVYSQYGYKVCLLNGQSARPLESAGFHCGTTGNSNETIHIDAKETGHAYREIWVGYFKEANVDALTALGSVANQLIEIKTKDWAYSRSSVLQTWSMPSGSHRFHLGEAVSLRYVGTSAINFTWTVPDTINNSPAYQEAAVQHFNYAEQADYTPFFVKVDSDKSITKNAQAELALYINGQCYGAEVVQGDTVQINGYINEIPDLEQATVEFRYWAGGEKAIEQKVDSYSVYNQEYQVYEKRPLEIDARKSFYVVSFDAKDNGSVPAVTTLETNYPNPFNPETTIKYSVAKAGKVNLSIYNIKGQLVRTLVNENQEPSYRSIVWKGENNNGSKVSSGVYFYRLQTAEKVMTKKMLLMK